MSKPIMNTIESHKHASIFANPVTNRGVEGYTEIIRRPQDLKSIRAMINAGTKAVAAAVEAVDANQDAASPGTTGAGAAIIMLPYDASLAPPHAIVNGAQLEQEVMRMFANAVMFNPGNDEIVEETREMFEDIENSINTWRETERGEKV